MIFSKRSELASSWHSLVVLFFDYLFGDHKKINDVLEKMADFGLENEKNLAKETFSRLEEAIAQLSILLDENSRLKRKAKQSFQLALLCVYRRNFFSRLLD